MKKRFVLVSFICAFFISFFSCNESSSISIMQALASSQPKDGKRWKSAEVVYNSSDSNKVDAVIILANDGMYVVDKDIEEKGDYLSKPTFKNNAKDSDGNIIINGLIRNVYVPSNYNSSSFANIIIQCVSSQLYTPSEYYKIDLKNLANVQKLTLDDSMGKFCAKSSSQSSNFIMMQSDSDSDKYSYKIGRYRINGDFISFEESISIQPEFKISNFFEDSDALNYIILTSTSGDDVKEQQYYKYSRASNTFEKLDKLYSLAIRNFKVHSDGTFMAFTQAGGVIHSSSNKNYLYTSDSYFSYNRYSPLVYFENKSKASEDEPDFTFFGKYSGNGFIIHGYNKTLTDDRIYNSNYKGSVQTQGYAESLRAEDISDIKAVELKSSRDDYDYRLLLLSSENGISTYLFKSMLPDQMKYNTQSVEIRNRVDLFI